MIDRLNDGDANTVRGEVTEFIKNPYHCYLNHQDIALLAEHLQFIPLHVNGLYKGGCVKAYHDRDVDARTSVVLEYPLVVPVSDGVATRQLAAMYQGCQEEWKPLCYLPVVPLLWSRIPKSRGWHLCWQ